MPRRNKVSLKTSPVEKWMRVQRWRVDGADGVLTSACFEALVGQAVG